MSWVLGAKPSWSNVCDASVHPCGLSTQWDPPPGFVAAPLSVARGSEGQWGGTRSPGHRLGAVASFYSRGFVIIAWSASVDVWRSSAMRQGSAVKALRAPGEVWRGVKSLCLEGLPGGSAGPGGGGSSADLGSGAFGQATPCRVHLGALQSPRRVEVGGGGSGAPQDDSCLLFEEALGSVSEVEMSTTRWFCEVIAAEGASRCCGPSLPFIGLLH